MFRLYIYLYSNFFFYYKYNLILILYMYNFCYLKCEKIYYEKIIFMLFGINFIVFKKNLKYNSM